MIGLKDEDRLDGHDATPRELQLAIDCVVEQFGAQTAEILLRASLTAEARSEWLYARLVRDQRARGTEAPKAS